METDYLILIRNPRDCYSCKERTKWTTERRLRTPYGVCMRHAGKLTERNPASPRDAIRNILASFPGAAAVDPVRELPSLGDYRATVACRWILSGRTHTSVVTLPSPALGPCVRCGRLCRLYGPGASPLCAECRTARVAQLAGRTS